jgi:hypothetical protein
VRLTLLNINFEGVIPANAGIQLENTGFRVKPGMTIKGNGFMTHHISQIETPAPWYDFALDLAKQFLKFSFN